MIVFCLCFMQLYEACLCISGVRIDLQKLSEMNDVSFWNWKGASPISKRHTCRFLLIIALFDAFYLGVVWSESWVIVWIQSRKKNMSFEIWIVQNAFQNKHIFSLSSFIPSGDSTTSVFVAEWSSKAEMTVSESGTLLETWKKLTQWNSCFWIGLKQYLHFLYHIPFHPATKKMEPWDFEILKLNLYSFDFNLVCSTWNKTTFSDFEIELVQFWFQMSSGTQIL